MMKKTLSFILAIFLLLIICCKSFRSGKNILQEVKSDDEKGYYLNSVNGADNNPGSRTKPLLTIDELNRRLQTESADIYLAGGQTFSGKLELDSIKRTKADPITITSYGEGRAVIDGGNGEAIKITDCFNVQVKELNLRGNGRKNGNRSSGLSAMRSGNCKIENVNSEGFQKSGVDLFNCTDSEIRKVIASDNGFSGINIMGSSRNLSRKILIQDCKAVNNPGDPSNTDNHSGNGILVGVSDSVLIDHCSATNNGWDMPREGNGPVGIWAWESDHVTIQYCISYRNKTSRNAKDGGGFDLDGGVTNSIIQYCLSYENQGAGFGLFQYSGASYWSDNIVRYSVSINDGQTTKGSGGFFIWNGSKESKQLKNCFIYNNVVYNTAAPLISFEDASDHENFIFCNNIFIGSGQPIQGIYAGSKFLGNDWWNTEGKSEFLKTTGLSEWAKETGQEMYKGQFVGMQTDPKFYGPFLTEITDPYLLNKLSGYILRDDSPLKNKGMDLNSIFGIKVPAKDFFDNPVPAGSGSEPGIYEMK